MTKFEIAALDPASIKRNAEGLLAAWLAGDSDIRAAFPLATEETIGDAVAAYMEEQTNGVVYMNDTYQVFLRETAMFGGMGIWLSIKRLDKKPIHDWRDLQQIKSEIAGEENEGIELYPAESRRVDSANQYHIWVLTGGVKFPVGFPERMVTDTPLLDAKQRPLTENRPLGDNVIEMKRKKKT